MATATIDLSAGLVPNAAPGGAAAPGGVDISAGLVPKQQPQIGTDPRFSEQDEGHQNRLSALAGLTGMPTINMTPQDQQSFQQGKAAGAVSVPIVAGAVAAPAAIGAGVSALAPAMTRGVIGMTAWAAEHPIAAKMIWEGLKSAMAGTAAGAGAKIAGKIINASSGGE